MEQHGDPCVLTRVMERTRLMAAGDPSNEKIRPGLLILCGAHRGVYGAGQVLSLAERGLMPSFVAVGGVSTGACTAAYAVAGQAKLGSSIYLEECLSTDFINPLNVLNPEPILRLDFLSDVFRGTKGKKKLDLGAIEAAKTRLQFAVTDAESGEGTLIDARKAQPDLVGAIRASIAIPVESKPVEVDGRLCYDGAIGATFPAQQFVEENGLTDLIVLANRSYAFRENTFWKRWLEAGFFHGLSPHLKEAIWRQDQTFNEGMDYLSKTKACRSTILFSDTTVRAFTRNPVTLKSAMERSFTHFSSLIDTAPSETVCAV